VTKRGLAPKVEQLANVGAHGALRKELVRTNQASGSRSGTEPDENATPAVTNERSGDGDGPAVGRAAALQRDAEGDDEQAAEDERPHEDVEARGVRSSKRLLGHHPAGVVATPRRRQARQRSFGSS
jgi:hypothetical protein